MVELTLWSAYLVAGLMVTLWPFYTHPEATADRMDDIVAESGVLVLGMIFTLFVLLWPAVLAVQIIMRGGR